MTQNHVLVCEEYKNCFEATAARFERSAEEIKEMIQSRDPNNCSREDLQELNNLEDHLSAQLLEKISGMRRPARARE